MGAREEFEKFLLEYTGRDIEWHKQGGTWGIDEDSFAYQCWLKNYEKAKLRGKALVMALDGSSVEELHKATGRSMSDCAIAFDVYKSALDDDL